jgi:hypothetical protein
VWAEFDGVKTSERVLTERMAAAFTDDMIVLADRGLYSYHLWTTDLLTKSWVIFGRAVRV